MSIEEDEASDTSVEEQGSRDDDESKHDELAYRLEQQSILAEFGSHALRIRKLDGVLDRAAQLVAVGMRASLSKVLRHDADTGKLKIIAGIGWRPGVVGEVQLDAGKSSPAGYAFQTGKSVLSNHLDRESRFRTPDIMIEHGVKRAINILIEVNEAPWGVLEVDSTDPGEFRTADFAFMRGFAHLVGVAIERNAVEQELEEANNYQEMLTREASHRIKNSLSMVSSMLALQRRAQLNEDVKAILKDAQDRISTIATAHDMLWQGSQVGIVDLGEMICTLVTQLTDQSPKNDIVCDVQSWDVSADVAIPIALVANELVTNAMKYAYSGEGGKIDLEGRIEAQNYVLTVRDMGGGFDVDHASSAESNSLGMRLIRTLSQQVQADVDLVSSNEGTLATIVCPIPDKPLA